MFVAQFNSVVLSQPISDSLKTPTVELKHSVFIPWVFAVGAEIFLSKKHSVGLTLGIAHTTFLDSEPDFQKYIISEYRYYYRTSHHINTRRYYLATSVKLADTEIVNEGSSYSEWLEVRAKDVNFSVLIGMKRYSGKTINVEFFYGPAFVLREYYEAKVDSVTFLQSNRTTNDTYFTARVGINVCYTFYKQRK